MKKILIIFLGIFSLLIINGGYCLAKQDIESFSVIESRMSEEFHIVENGVKFQYFTNLSEKQENERIENCIVNKYGVDVVKKGNNIKAESENVKLDISIYSIDDKTKVEEIDKEQELCSKIGMAFLSGDIGKIMAATTEDNYQLLLKQAQALVEGENDWIANTANISALLFNS